MIGAEKVKDLIDENGRISEAAWQGLTKAEQADILKKLNSGFATGNKELIDKLEAMEAGDTPEVKASGAAILSTTVAVVGALLL